MCKYFLLCLVVLCGCSKSAPVGIGPKQKQDASMPQIAASQDFEVSADVAEVDVLELILKDRDKWFAYYEYTEPDISQEAIRKIDKVYTLKTKDEILDKRYSSNIYHYSYDEYGIKAYHARDYFFKANEYRDKQDYENALKYYEIALSVYDWSAFYYHYGSLLMDMGDYENAERAFNKAINKFHYYSPYSLIAPYYPKWGRNNIYTFDSSGIARELYFSYYNLACLYSIENKLQESEDNIILALENGYPYLDHILADPDLENLFNAPNADEIKDRINQVYSDGMVNNVRGKTFEYMPGPNDLVEYEFVNDREIRLHLRTSDDRDHIQYGFYIVKNYHVIIYYNRVTGRKGYGEAFNAGVGTGYRNYAPYDESIEDFEYISLAYMATRGNGWGWKEIIDNNKETIVGKGFKLNLGGAYEEYYFVDSNYMLIYYNSMSLWRPILVKAKYQYSEDGTIIINNIDYIYRSSEDSGIWNVEDSELWKLGSISSFYDKYPDDGSGQWVKFEEIPIESYNDIKESYRKFYGIQIREEM